MKDRFELKPIHDNAVVEALRKAERYRLLNEPAQAESICRDILRIEPKNQKALVVIILSITDQFSEPNSPGARIARNFAAELEDAYQKVYYAALICERKARALIKRGHAASFAYDGFREAMDLYEQARKLEPEGRDDCILRWNSCVRTIRKANLRPRAEEEELFLE